MSNIFIEKTIKINDCSLYRKFSFAQKIRKDLLRLIILFPNQKERINNCVKEFNLLTNNNFKNYEEVFGYSFKSNFNNLYSQSLTLSPKKMIGTNISKKILNFFKNLNNEFLELYLHGSHADNTFTNYSDIDVTIFIKKNFLTQLNRMRLDLLALNNFIRQFDLDSHHATFLNFEDDKNYYPESFMPLDVYNQSITNVKNKIQFKTRFCDDLTLDNFFRIKTNTQTLIKNISQINSKNLKLLISQYFITIILHYQFINNKFKDKKFIFSSIIYKNCFISDKKTFEICSEIREKWPKKSKNNNFGISHELLSKMSLEMDYLENSILNSKNFKQTMDLIS